SIVMGIVQGLTEFLPISSIAHMQLVAAFFHGWERPSAAFSAVVQMIAYISVLMYFRRDYLGMARHISRRTATPEGKLCWMLIVGTVPIGVLGLLLHKKIEEQWRTPTIIAWALIILAVFLAIAEWTERRRKQKGQALRELNELGWRDAI